jgi:hypothetical protein
MSSVTVAYYQEESITCLGAAKALHNLGFEWCPEEEREDFGIALSIAASESNSEQCQKNVERRKYLRRCQLMPKS